MLKSTSITLLNSILIGQGGFVYLVLIKIQETTTMLPLFNALTHLPIKGLLAKSNLLQGFGFLQVVEEWTRL